MSTSTLPFAPPIRRPLKIISGGQTGADQGALIAARRLGIPTGGWMPRRFLTEVGPCPELRDVYRMQEHSSLKYPPRTRLNVLESDGTVWTGLAADIDSRGKQATVREVVSLGKPFLDSPDAKTLRRWVVQYDIRVLNVAGPRESLDWQGRQRTIDLITEAFIIMGPILLEGPDGSGKSTLAATLAERLDLRSFKNGPPSPGEDLLTTYDGQLLSNTVIDRAWPSEVIYAPLLGRTPLISMNQSATLFEKLYQLGGRVVVCLPPLYACEKTWRDRAGELFKDPAILAKAWSGYAELVRELHHKPEFLKIHNRLLEQSNEEVFAWLREH